MMSCTLYGTLVLSATTVSSRHLRAIIRVHLLFNIVNFRDKNGGIDTLHGTLIHKSKDNLQWSYNYGACTVYYCNVFEF